MRLRVSSVLLALFAGCTARAGWIQFNDVITSGEGTFYFWSQRFTATVQGPAMEYTLTTGGQNPLSGGVSVGGGEPYGGSGQGGFTDDGLFLGCSASAASNCFAAMGITLLGTPVVTGFINNDEIESQLFTGYLYLSGCDGPGCATDSCYSAGTNCFNAGFLGGGTATITLVPIAPGVYYESEAVFNFIATPEPSTMMLAALGLAGIALACRTRRSAQL